MIRRSLLIFAIVLFYVSACDKTPNSEAPATDSATRTEKVLVADPDAGKLLAQKCQQCHGDDGNKSIDGSPYLAGQQTGYLIAAMQSYLNDERPQKDMKNALQALTEDDLLNLASYYNGQDANWKHIKVAKKSSTIAVNKRTISRGKRLSSQCKGCHGEKGNAPINGSPSLAGLPPEYFKSAFLDYFKGNRREKKVIMKHFSRSLSKSNVAHLAAYYSVQIPKKSPFPFNGNAGAEQALASRSCDGCHGLNGNSGSATIPSLTGQNARYLVMALQTYKKGMRKNKLMKDVVTPLKNSQLINLAAHYAKQKPKKIKPATTQQSKSFDPIGQGGNIAAACNGCHGKNGNSSLSGTPSLSGLGPLYITMAINTYKTGQRKHEIMKSLVAKLSDSDIEKVSLYYASQQPTPMPPTLIKNIKADPKAAEAMASACTSCHGDMGNSSQADTPSIAGQEPGYMIFAINQYKNGTRKNDSMQNAVAKLTNTDINNYAAYFAMKTRNKPEVRVPEAPKILAEKCFRCHGHNGLSNDEKTPRLAGQLESYLLNALKQYSDETRKQSTMHAMAANLSLLELKAIAQYFAELK